MFNVKHFWSIGKILDNDNVTQLGTGENLTTTLQGETVNPENALNETKI